MGSEMCIRDRLSADQQRAIRDELISPASSIGGAHPTMSGTVQGFVQTIQDAPPELFQEVTRAARKLYPRDITWSQNEMKQEVVVWSALSEMYFNRTGGDLTDDLEGSAQQVRAVFSEFKSWKNDEGEALFPNLEKFWGGVADAGETAQDAFVQVLETSTGQNPLTLYGSPYDELSEATRQKNYQIAWQQAQRAKTAQRQERHNRTQRGIAQAEQEISNGEWDPTQERPGWMPADQWGRLQGLYLKEQEHLSTKHTQHLSLIHI